MRKCSKPGCSGEGKHKYSESSMYCDKHRRFQTMKNKARRDGKLVPTGEQLEEMLKPCLSADGSLICPRSKKSMQWVAGADGRKGSTVSLQHNLNGTMEFVSHSANVSHKNSKLGDLYWNLKDNEKFCPDCSTVKDKTSFGRCRRNPNGLQCRCRTCSNAMNKANRAKKRLNQTSTK